MTGRHFVTSAFEGGKITSVFIDTYFFLSFFLLHLVKFRIFFVLSCLLHFPHFLKSLFYLLCNFIPQLLLVFSLLYIHILISLLYFSFTATQDYSLVPASSLLLYYSYSFTLHFFSLFWLSFHLLTTLLHFLIVSEPDFIIIGMKAMMAYTLNSW